MRTLQRALGDHPQAVWIDSREPVIRKAIEDASAYVVAVSTASLLVKVGVQGAPPRLEVQKQRRKDTYPIVPLLLDGTKLGAFEALFDDEPLHVAIRSAAGGVEGALHPILVALGKRLPTELDSMPQPDPANPDLNLC